jgi:CBS domain-containing protein
MRREFITVVAGEPLLEAQRTMQLARLRHVPVVEDERLVGIVSYRDVQDELLACAARESGAAWREALRAVPVRKAMLADPYYVLPETPAIDAARRMLRLRLGCLPVCEDGAALRLVGLLAESDLLRAAWR